MRPEESLSTMRALSDIKITPKLAVAVVSLSAVTVGVGALGYTRLSGSEADIRWTERTYQWLAASGGRTALR